MWPTLLYALLAIAICGWVFTTFRQRRKVHALERSKEEIQVEETLVFDFLHGLGEAFRETIKPHDLHRLIVEGATRILDANGGALYLTDRSGNKLVPMFLSKGCPPRGTASLMATALLDGKQHMGVLAVGNGPMGAPFTPSDFVVFKSIAEQSAFALYNAIIYSEANEKKRLDHDLEIARDIQRI